MHSDTLVLKIKKRTMLTEMRLKSFGTFENGPQISYLLLLPFLHVSMGLGSYISSFKYISILNRFLY